LVWAALSLPQREIKLYSAFSSARGAARGAALGAACAAALGAACGAAVGAAVGAALGTAAVAQLHVCGAAKVSFALAQP
jgi:hypothetical protein